MEFINPNEYYKKLVKGKNKQIEAKERMSEEKINQLEEICNKFLMIKIKENNRRRTIRLE